RAATALGRLPGDAYGVPARRGDETSGASRSAGADDEHAVQRRPPTYRTVHAATWQSSPYLKAREAPASPPHAAAPAPPPPFPSRRSARRRARRPDAPPAARRRSRASRSSSSAPP